MNILEIIIEELIKSRIKTEVDLASFKRKIAKKYKISLPSNIKLLKAYHKSLKNRRVVRSEVIENLLKTRPIRSLSGIVNVSVLTKPYPCPGKCLYCPLEKGIPKSYLSGEPAVERAKKLKYNPYLQVKRRIEMLRVEGHPTDKIEMRIVGGTWSYYPIQYREWFIKKCYEACNEKKSKNLREVQKLNEKAKHRIVGLSIETRPDFIDEKEIKHLRKLGVTKVELGVQSIYDDILKLNIRGHGVKTTIEATKLLKDAGFKVSYQMMLNLPGSNPKKDIKMFEEIFESSDFRPDLLKIYPCALVREAKLYQWYLKGKYKPYSEKTLIDIISKIKKKMPIFVRIERITRDIPAQKIVTGPTKISNLRQVVAERMKKEGWQCKCIRCKEIKGDYPPPLKALEGKVIQRLKLFREDYDASGGKEIFLSLENKKRNKLYSLLRLRIPSFAKASEGKPPQRYFISVLDNAAIIREVHTYGYQLPISTQQKTSPQHKGLGKKLIKEAEKITKREFGLNKIAAIAAVGTRDYFKKLGYELKETYMIKKLAF